MLLKCPLEKDETKRHFGDFIHVYGAKYPKAAECLERDREKLLTFYDFPAEHWRHILTTNPIESTFAAVRLRTAKVRGCFSAQTVITMAFKLCQCSQKRWIRLYHPQRLAVVIRGVQFVNGIEESLTLPKTPRHIAIREKQYLINIIYYRQRNFLAKHLNQKHQGGHYED